MISYSPSLHPFRIIFPWQPTDLSSPLLHLPSLISITPLFVELPLPHRLPSLAPSPFPSSLPSHLPHHPPLLSPFPYFSPSPASRSPEGGTEAQNELKAKIEGLKAVGDALAVASADRLSDLEQANQLTALVAETHEDLGKWLGK